MSIFFLLLSIVLFAVLNRARGGAIVGIKPFVAMTLSYIVLARFAPLDITGAIIVSLLVGALYFALESICGWGVFLGAILKRKKVTELEEKECWFIHQALQIQRWLNIEKHWLWYCRIMLAVRGMVWGMCLLPLSYFLPLLHVSLSIIVLGIAFPLCAELGRLTDGKYNFHPYVGGDWDHQELYYGAVFGAVFYYLLV